jgi:drug/metabolite transporter (DMT)-like permease
MTTRTWRLVAAFAAVYLIWGSTYLAIRWAIETLPTFLMAGVRFVVAGSILYLWGRARGAPAPTRAAWRDAVVVGGLLLLGGNGGVVWAEQYVPSGFAALVVATEPLWIVLLDWIRPGGNRPTAGEALGLLLGFGGVVLLIGPGQSAGGGVHPAGALVLIGATVAWASGSLYSRSARSATDPLLSTGTHMLAGGTLLLIAAAAAGQWKAVSPASVSVRSWLALLYLIVFGAIVGFTAYLWILRESTVALVSTYAYVNPVVAVFLGWALAGEAITARMIGAAAVIVTSVVLITLSRTRALARTGTLLRRAVEWTARRRRAA